MNNKLVLWDSPNGVSIPSVSNFGLENIIDNHAVQLRPKEKSNIIKAFRNEIFDMPSEYIWGRTIAILKEKVISFGENFVLEMLDRSSKDSVENISDHEYITLSNELGFINRIAKDKFIHANTLITYYQSRDVEEEMSEGDMLTVILPCFQYILGMQPNDFSASFNTFRDDLKLHTLNDDSPIIKILESSPYFYKKTVVKTVLNLTKETDGGEFENVLINMTLILDKVWDTILSNDKYNIGKAYSEAINNAEKKLSVSLRRVLLSNEGFNYVPENLRSQSFIEYAKKLKTAHFGFDNFYNEVAPAKDLANMGSIPPAAVSHCLSAVLLSKLGNSFGVSISAQPHVNKILSELPIDRWEHYFNDAFKGDSDVLYKLTRDSRMLEKWIEYVKNQEELFLKLKLKDSFSQRVINYSLENKTQDIINAVKKQYREI